MHVAGRSVLSGAVGLRLDFGLLVNGYSKVWTLRNREIETETLILAPISQW